MVARIMIPLIIAIMLSDLYIDQHYWQHHRGYRWWKRLLWWLPSMGMLVYTLILGTIRNFVPDDLRWVNLYMLLVGIVVYPKAVFSLFSILGRIFRRFIVHTHRNWGTPVATVIILVSYFMLAYGSTVGFRRLKVVHIDLSYPDLPPAFDGYRIVHFSDAHVGTLTGSLRHLLQRDVDSINAQHPDLIAFTGDLQNIQPREIKPVVPLLSQLRARDGVVSVLGNHDYAEYVKVPAAEAAANCRQTVAFERACGWRLLRNEHCVIRANRTLNCPTAPTSPAPCGALVRRPSPSSCSIIPKPGMSISAATGVRASPLPATPTAGSCQSSDCAPRRLPIVRTTVSTAGTGSISTSLPA